MSKAFTIERSKWVNATVAETLKQHTALLNNHGRMCCLGFYSLACGLTDAEIRHIGTPSELSALPKEMEWLNRPATQSEIVIPSNDCFDLTDANDSTLVSDAEREERIIHLFAKHGIDVTFTGDLLTT